MRILSMTATFGKLSRQTLTLEPGLNIIEAPNEWGKSTWCAFLMAMLYGIDTASRSKTGFLADKEHYAPWSGEPMSGSMDILWNGRAITLERRSKGRLPLGEVKAFETGTGVAVPELCVAMPGQVLLGVERSVFARAGFLKLSEMPVTEDESLRRRLNELVTTADESGASDDLAQKLRDLKNRCRFNRKGLLPELEAQQVELDKKLQQLQALQYQISSIRERQNALEAQEKQLENHRQALEYSEHLQYTQKLAAAQMRRDVAAESLAQGEAACAALPAQEKIRQDMAALQQLRDTRDALHMQAQLLPPLPQAPIPAEPFRGKDPYEAVTDARLDGKVLTQLKNDKKSPLLYVLGGLFLVLGAVLLILINSLPVQLGGGIFLLCGVACLIAGFTKRKKLQKQIAALLERYRGIPEDRWEAAATEYASSQQTYNDALAARQQELGEINRNLEANVRAITQLTGGDNLSQFEETCRQQQLAYSRLQEQQRALRQAEEVLQALSGAGKQVAPPEFEDTLTLSPQETAKRLSDSTLERQLLHQRLGQCQGQMEALGQEESLQAQKQQLQTRIAALEQHYRALTRAQETLQQATQELQRRFAPRISQRTQTLFAKLTGQRYQRLSLGQDLSLEAGAQGETTLRGTLWRSDGTVDQLYLALRLAVAEELTPEAPLVLDDALVRFDDVRLAAALEILREEAEQKQVILFTCQGREQALHAKEEV